MSSYYYICVRIRYICVLILPYVSSYSDISVLILLHMCPQANRVALADCSVLCVPSLLNAPGMGAGRLVRESGGWEGAMEALHEQLLAQQIAPPGSSATAAPDMRAAYHCTMTLAYPNGKKVLYMSRNRALIEP